MKNLYTKIFVLKKYMEKTKEIPWNMKHRFHEANPKILKIRQADCDTIRLVNGCESSGVERYRARGFLVQRRTSTRPPRAESRKEKEKNNKPQLWTKTSTKNHGQTNTTKACLLATKEFKYDPDQVNRLGSFGRVSLSMVFSAGFCPELRLVVLLFFLS